MMTINPVAAVSQAAHYYKETDDYYREEASAPSRWHGELAREFNLEGEVEKEDFVALLSGDMPDGSRLGRWGKNADGETVWQHRPGYDCTFSAPKSVSVMALVGGDDRLLEAHDAAVREALAELEKRTCTRIRSTAGGGVRVEYTSRLVAASFRHETSRNQDAQLHSHCVIANATRGMDGQWRSLESRAYYSAQHEAGLVYQQALGRRLRELGYQVDRVSDRGAGHIEIRGVPEDLVQLHSSRREQIREALAKRGLDIDATGGGKRQLSTLSTRKAKGATDHAALRAAWQAHAREAGHDLEGLIDEAKKRALDTGGSGNGGHGCGGGMTRSPDGPRGDTRAAAAEAVTLAREILSERETRFTRAGLESLAVRESLATSVTLDEIRAAIEDEVENGELIARIVPARDPATGGQTTAHGYTTREGIATERAMLAIEAQGRGRAEALMTEEQARAIVSQAEAQSEHPWTRGQRDATIGILTGRDRITAVQGYAGTAKTTTVLRTVAAVAARDGYAVRGLTPTAAAAEQLREGAGVEQVDTVAGFLQRARAGASNEGPELWLVDEMSMLSARDARDVLRAAERRGARVVAVGDVKQLGSVEAGRAFAQLQDAGMTTHVLDEIVRQRSSELRQGVEASIAGDAARALRHIERSGEIHEIRDAGERLEAIAQRYLSMSAEERAQTLVIDPSRAGRQALNERIRSGLREEGTLHGPELEATLRQKKDVTGPEKKTIYAYEEGDKVQFRREYKGAELEAGREYRVTGRDMERGVVKIEDEKGQQREFEPAKMSPRNVQVYEETRGGLAAGDRITFTENNKDLGVNNGSRATVERVDQGRQRVDVRLESGRTLELDLSKPDSKNIRHDYANTVHAVQGRDKTIGLPNLDSRSESLVHQRSMYTTLSRFKERVELYTDDRERLVRGIEARTGEKTQALEAERGRQQAQEQDQAQGQAQEAEKGQEPAQEQEQAPGRSQEAAQGQESQERDQQGRQQAREETREQDAGDDHTQDQDRSREQERERERVRDRGDDHGLGM